MILRLIATLGLVPLNVIKDVMGSELPDIIKDFLELISSFNKHHVISLRLIDTNYEAFKRGDVVLISDDQRLLKDAMVNIVPDIVAVEVK